MKCALLVCAGLLALSSFSAALAGGTAARITVAPAPPRTGGVETIDVHAGDVPRRLLPMHLNIRWNGQTVLRSRLVAVRAGLWRARLSFSRRGLWTVVAVGRDATVLASRTLQVRRG